MILTTGICRTDPVAGSALPDAASHSRVGFLRRVARMPRRRAGRRRSEPHHSAAPGPHFGPTLEVRMILIDEIHSILSGAAREQRVILNAIRLLAFDLQVPIVCAGTPGR
jgi:hypothetical protein